MTAVLVFVLGALSSFVATWAVRCHALSSGLLDHPNARSSHDQPTPRGGGVAIAVTTLIGCIVISAWSEFDLLLSTIIAAAGMTIAIVGYVDDRRGLSAGSRMAVHVFATALALWAITTRLGLSDVLPGLHPMLAMLVIGVAVVWSTNLYNFMDGIDGIAASQAVFVGAATSVLAAASADDPAVLVMVVFSGASLGFLFWNKPRAKIFMGDVGSGFLGFWLAVWALILHGEGIVSIWTSIILSSLFVADATATLIRRVVNGRRWHAAHRSHVYQQLARRWKSHAKTSGLFLSINVGVVFPLAVLSQRYSDLASTIAICTVAAFCAIAWLAGAGKEEHFDMAVSAS